MLHKMYSLLCKVLQAGAMPFIKSYSVLPVWSKKVFASLVTGLATFCFLFYWPLNCSLQTAIFLSAFAIFIVAAGYIVNTYDEWKAEKFCDKYETIAVILFFISATGVLIKFANWLSELFIVNTWFNEITTFCVNFLNNGVWQLFVWPLLIVSAILFILAEFGKIGIALTLSEKMNYEMEG